MLLNIKCFGAGIAQSTAMYVDVPTKATVADLIRQVHLVRPDIEVKRLLFAGKQLKDFDSLLETYDVYKECTIQLFGSVVERHKDVDIKSDEEDEDDYVQVEKPDLGDPHPDLSYGDIIMVHLVNARNLVPLNLTGKSDPYVIFIYDHQTSRSNVVKKSVDPTWNEVFGFYVPPDVSLTATDKEAQRQRKRSSKLVKKTLKGKKQFLLDQQDKFLSVLAFDHDFITPDESLGQFEIALDEIPRDRVIEKYFTLHGVGSGEIMLSIRRAALTSPAMTSITKKLVALERPWVNQDLEDLGVTMSMLVGSEPFVKTMRGRSIHEDAAGQDLSINPALTHLSDLLLNDKLTLETEHTASKVLKILHSQNALENLDPFSRHLWVCELHVSEQVLFFEMQRCTQGSVKKFLFIPGAKHSTAYISFTTLKASLLALLVLKNDISCRVGFGKNLKRRDPEVQSVLSGFALVDPGKALRTDGLMIGEDEGQEREQVGWSTHWIVLSIWNGQVMIRGYSCLSDEEPSFVIPISQCLFLKTGPWTVEIVDKVSKLSYKLKCHTTEDLDLWHSEFKRVRSHIDDEKIDIDALGYMSAEGRFTVNCNICLQHENLFGCYAVDSKIKLTDSATASLACLSCLRKSVQFFFEERDFVGVSNEFSIQDLQDILDPNDFEVYLEGTLKDYLSSDNKFATCPSCSIPVELYAGSKSDILGRKMIGVDHRPVRKSGIKHYLKYRVRCRTHSCHTDFCSECLVSPYHIGLDCEQFIEFQEAPKCRFCKTAVTSLTSLEHPDPAFKLVCNQEECKAKVAIACNKTLICGHYCFGSKGEAICPPCLKADCKEHPDGAPIVEDPCSICYTDDLGLAPYIMLSCSHSFHKECMLEKLAKGYPGSRINFDFAKCPLCRVDIFHQDLDTELTPIRELQGIIQARSLQRLEHEGLMNDPAIIEVGGLFYEDPVGFAMNHFSFYKCFQCTNPYFAGARECGPAGGDDEHPEEDAAQLVCAKCANVESYITCPTHGDDWIAYKCRYCCTVASFQCWGTTHFCESCHKPGTWDKLAKFKTGENLKQIEEYQQCPGLRRQIDSYLKANPKATREEKDKAMSNFVSEPEECPLKMKHAVAGNEFGIGCTMCANRTDEQKHKEEERLANREMKKSKKAMIAYWQTLPDNTKFHYLKDFDGQGIIASLGSAGGARKFVNPALKQVGLLRVRSCQLARDSEPAWNWIGDKVVRCVTKNIMNSWFSVDFIDHFVKPTHYSLRHYSSWDVEALRTWVLEASNDDANWTVLSTHNKDSALHSKGGTFTWPLDATGRFRLFRLRLTGKNSNKHYHLACSGFELYGEVVIVEAEKTPMISKQLSQGLLIKKEDPVRVSIEMDKPSRVVEFVPGSPLEGILHLIGTQQGSRAWSNPADLKLVSVIASSIMKDSVPMNAVVGKESLRCVTRNSANSWIIIDFHDVFVAPTHYSIRHYASWNVEAVRCWNFEGSNDKVRWDILKSHTDDESIKSKGQIVTFPVDPNNHMAYRFFRIFQTGYNSNRHHYLAISGFEVFGTLYSSEKAAENDSHIMDVSQDNRLELGVAKEARVFNYKSDMDTNGVLYNLGTKMGSQSWQNPAIAGIVRVGSSALMGDSVHIDALVGRDVVRLCSRPVANSWFVVDLLDKYLVPTDYTLRHYSSWDAEALRTWVLEGSQDGESYEVISKHNQDKHLAKKGATHTWKINTVKQFRSFRLRITGKNSNNHLYLCCSGIELYGKLYFQKP